MAVRNFNNGSPATVSSTVFELAVTDIASTLGGTAPHSLSEYYGFDSTADTPIPTSGPLDTGDRDFHARPRPQKGTATGINIVNISATQATISIILSSIGNYGDLLYQMLPGGPATYPGGFTNDWVATNSFTVTRGAPYTIWAIRRNYIVGQDNYGWTYSTGWWRTVS